MNELVGETFRTTEKQASLKPRDAGPVDDPGKLAELIAIDESQRAAGNISVVTADDNWRLPLPVERTLPPVDAFYPDLLPDCLRSRALDISERMQVPPDLPAAFLILALAGSVNRRALIQPKLEDDSWVVNPNLYGAGVAPPGAMKSPMISGILAPLQAVQNEMNLLYELKEKEAKNRETAKPKGKRFSILAGGLAAASYGTKSPKEEKPERDYFLIGDSTAEKLHEMNAKVQEGLVVVREEMGGFLKGLETKGREQERPFYLTAWNGNSPYSMHRIGRGSIWAKAVCITLMGAIQPDNLATYMNMADLTVDGFLQRLQVFVYPDPMRSYTYTDRKPDAAATARVDRLFRSLIALKEGALTARFSSDAQTMFTQWLIDLEARKLRNPAESSHMIQHLAKYRSLMPKLALLSELADIGGADDFSSFERFMGTTIDVRPENAQRAANLCMYLESHARRIYSLVGKQEVTAAAMLTDRIKAGNIGAGGHFTLNELVKKDWRGMTTNESAAQAIQTLIKHSWVREAPVGSGPKGGRPTVHYMVNPLIWAEGQKS